MKKREPRKIAKKPHTQPPIIYVCMYGADVCIFECMFLLLGTV